MTPRTWARTVRAAYVAVVLLATLSNLEFSPQLGPAAFRLVRAFTPSLGWHDAIDGVRNVLLFGGMGAVWVLTAVRQMARGEVRRATVAGLVLSSLIEGLQTFSPIRDASIVDVLTDTLGAFGGAVVLVLVIEAIRRPNVRAASRVPLRLVVWPYLLAVVAEALTPLFSSAPDNLDGGPVHRLGATWALASSLSWRDVPYSDAPLLLAAGFLGVLLALDGGQPPRRAWRIVAGFGTAVLVVTHVAHGAAGLPIHRQAIVLDCAALVAGAWMGIWRPARRAMAWPHSEPARAALIGYAWLLVLWGWRPFALEFGRTAILNELAPEHFIPLRALAERVDLFSVAHTAQQFLLYVPLGALLAGRRSEPRRRATALWLAVSLPVVIELGHIVVAQRTFDITNALLAGVGVAVGWRIRWLTSAEQLATPGCVDRARSVVAHGPQYERGPSPRRGERVVTDGADA